MAATFKLNSKNVITQSGTAEPAISSIVVFPAGHIINIESTKQTSDTADAGTGTWISDSITIGSTDSDVLVLISGWVRKSNGGAESGGHTRLYMSGGGFGADGSGYQIAGQIGYGEGASNSETMLGQSVLDTAPGSTTPTYGLYSSVQSSGVFRYRLQIVLMEILA